MPTYAQQSDIEDLFGPANVAAWSRFETGTPSGPTDTSRVATALAYADGEINAWFAGGPYALPLVCTLCKPLVTYWAAVIAGVWLYGNRASVSYIDYSGNRYIALRNAVYQDMDAYKAGVKRLDAAMRFPHATAPVGD
ncbi:MAG TPA: phage protein Gp36 family protein [Tepidisphaeraceae bacterium]|nr:phage protein Gp36 family protein [Tepidisphaeraceae bacterium]